MINQIKERFTVTREINLSSYEKENIFLEGTGSMVLDRENKIAYACLSPRTHAKALADFCRQMDYDAVVFDATDGTGAPIYHTNVMMCVADRYVVICLDPLPMGNKKTM